jgi:hypothetical protein
MPVQKPLWARGEERSVRVLAQICPVRSRRFGHLVAPKVRRGAAVALHSWIDNIVAVFVDAKLLNLDGAPQSFRAIMTLSEIRGRWARTPSPGNLCPSRNDCSSTGVSMGSDYNDVWKGGC